MGCQNREKERGLYKESCWELERSYYDTDLSVVLKVMGPFGLQIILRHLVFRGIKMGP